MARAKITSPTLAKIHGSIPDDEMSRKIIAKLLQYNARYEAITQTILSHSERAFMDARLAFLESYYKELDAKKNPAMKSYVSELLSHPEMIQYI